MMKHVIAFLICCAGAWSSLHAQAVGSWQVFRAMNNITNVVKADAQHYYVLASKNVYMCNEADGSITFFDKTNGMNDVDVQFMAWSDTAKKLVVAYENQNIDLVQPNGEVTNIADIKNTTAYADKTFNAITVTDNTAWLATAFGVVRIDLLDNVVKDTYATPFPVHYVSLQGNTLVLDSRDHGRYTALLTQNLYNPNVWKRVGNYVEPPTNDFSQHLDVVKKYNPGGPKNNNFGFLTFQHNRLYTTGGGFLPLNEQYRAATIQVWDGQQWQVFPDDNIGQELQHDFLDNNVLAVDAGDANHLFAAGRTGVYEFKDQKLVSHYTVGTPFLYAASTVNNPDNKNYVVVQGMTYDPQGNLWMANSISPASSLMVFTTDRKWVSHHNEALMLMPNRSLENMVSMMFDNRNYLWFCNYYFRKPAVVRYNPQTKDIKVIDRFVNQDMAVVETDMVKAVTQDKDGNIWVATQGGPLMLTPDEAYGDDPVFTQVKIARNDGTNFADYLLSGVDVQCIVVDGANRKWMGTQYHGIYVVSADNQQQIYHFTAENSPLLSNTIEAMTIDPNTGMVYIGTDKGLCAYRSDATEAQPLADDGQIYAFPNPVQPNYSGPITINGLPYKAEVKIVNAAGVLVNQGISNGGSYVWNGNNLQGRRVASGVYVVLVSTADGSKGGQCRIAIVN